MTYFDAVFERIGDVPVVLQDFPALEKIVDVTKLDFLDNPTMRALRTAFQIRDGRLRLDTPVTISARSSLMGGSQIYLRAGSVWPVKNLLIATKVQSANDAAQALAEKIAGSSENFADMMNQRAQELGLTWRAGVSELARTRWAKHYVVTHDGRQLDLGPHVALGAR